jgi:hypothetical protein
MPSEKHRKALLSYKDKHHGKSCIVCGLGPSLEQLTDEAKELFYTIGVNDIGCSFTPDYLITSEDPMRRFKQRKWNKKQMAILNSKAKAIFSVYGGRFKHSRPIRVIMEDLRRNHIENIFEHNHLFAYRKITTAAISLAVWMGFKTIGVIGHDCTGPRAINDLNDSLGMHGNRVEIMEKNLETIYTYCIKRGIQVFNLSDMSAVKAFPFLRLEDFITITKGALFE